MDRTLLEHPEIREKMKRIAKQRELLAQELVAVARKSSDPNVLAVVSRLDAWAGVEEFMNG